MKNEDNKEVSDSTQGDKLNPEKSQITTANNDQNFQVMNDQIMSLK